MVADSAAKLSLPASLAYGESQASDVTTAHTSNRAFMIYATRLQFTA
jgi:hypothetical protein